MHKPLFTLAVAVLIAGCSAAPAAPTQTAGQTPSQSVTTASATPAPSASGTLTTPSTAPTPSVRTITIVLKNGKVSPNGDRVDLDKGEPFVLDITSDRDDEVHVHGFDIEIEVEAGDHVQVPMTADRTGRFEVESHHPEMLIVTLQIR